MSKKPPIYFQPVNESGYRIYISAIYAPSSDTAYVPCLLYPTQCITLSSQNIYWRFWYVGIMSLIFQASSLATIRSVQFGTRKGVKILVKQVKFNLCILISSNKLLNPTRSIQLGVQKIYLNCL